MVKALEVSIDGKLVGNYVPPAGKTFSAVLANVPKTYMRAQVFSGGPDSETWQWQLPASRSHITTLRSWSGIRAYLMLFSLPCIPFGRTKGSIRVMHLDR